MVNLSLIKTFSQLTWMKVSYCQWIIIHVLKQYSPESFNIIMHLNTTSACDKVMIAFLDHSLCSIKLCIIKSIHNIKSIHKSTFITQYDTKENKQINI